MYKIFIDTNIFLDFYRINKNDEIKKVLNEIKKYKMFFINTEQSIDEFLRNRERAINNFVTDLRKQNYSIFNNNFIATLESYDDYFKSVKKANDATKNIIKECVALIEDNNKDIIYKTYFSIFNIKKSYKRTDSIIDKAIKRKYIGNPPTSNGKTTCCDEIIWETLLENCSEDLVIVSRDETFNDNYNFLKKEYLEKNQKQLVVVSTISEAIELNGKFPIKILENLENDIVVENDITNYGYIKDKSNWVSIIYNALLTLGGEAELKDIYNESINIVSKKYPEKMSNKEKESTRMVILQRYSEEYNNKYQIFTKIKKGVWAIKENNDYSKL